MIRIFNNFSAFSFLSFIFFSSTVSAETQYIQCTYLLERWKINALAEFESCPSGETGLGKPWLVETFTFDLQQGVLSDSSITRNYCKGTVETVPAKLSIQPNALNFIEKLTYNDKQKITSISRSDLRTNSGAHCEVIKAEKNKI